MNTEPIQLKTDYKNQILRPKELLLYIENKWKSLASLIFLVMTCCIGCETTTNHQKNNITSLLVSSLPPFPAPSAKVANELEQVCKEDKCKALFEWIGELKVMQEQLKLYEKEYE